MTSSSARGRNGTRYRYYRCVKQQNEGKHCPSGLLGVDEVEAAVVSQLRDVTRAEELRDAILSQLGRDRGDEMRNALEETQSRSAELRGKARRLVQALSVAPTSKVVAAELTKVEGELEVLAHRDLQIRDQLAGAEAARAQGQKVAALLEAFDKIWEALVAQERSELLHVLIRSITVDPERGGLRIAFYGPRPSVLEPTA
jgi:hypothetical protein